MKNQKSVLSGIPLDISHLVLRRSFEGYSSPFDLYRCPVSGVVQTIPMPSIEELKKNEYNDDYMAYHNDNLNKTSITARRRLKRILKFFKVKEHVSLLDIGCSTGWFLKVAQDFGFEIAGIELSEFAAKKANKLLDGDFVKTTALNETSFPTEYFDIIHSNQVLEHIQEPIEFINAQRKLLKKDGILVLGTPNMDSLSFKLMRGEWASLKKPDHLIMYNKKSIKYLLDKTGFEILSIYYTGMPPIFFKRRKIVNTNINQINSKNINLKNKKWSLKHFVLKNEILSNFFSAIINQLRLGDTMYVIAKKK